MSKNQLLPETPLIEIDGFFLKREDLNPSGSVKDRAVIEQLRWARDNGYSRVAISSSGNAGISVAYWAPQFSLQATIFISPRINPGKLKKLKRLRAKTKITSRPISSCLKFCLQNKILNLRQSKDPRALKGFANLGRELAAQLLALGEKKAAIFFPASSGATLCGTVRGMLATRLSAIPFVVQPASHPVLAKSWDSQFSPETKRLADSLVARALPLRQKITRIIKQTRGGGVVVQNKEILKWHRWLIDKGIKTSLEGGVALAGIQKAKKLIFTSRPALSKLPTVCLLTGRLY